MLNWIKFLDISCYHSCALRTKKRMKVVMKVLNNVANKNPEIADFIEDNLNEVWQNEKISVEEVYYFVALHF